MGYDIWEVARLACLGWCGMAAEVALGEKYIAGASQTGSFAVGQSCPEGGSLTGQGELDSYSEGDSSTGQLEFDIHSGGTSSSHWEIAGSRLGRDTIAHLVLSSHLSYTGGGSSAGFVDAERYSDGGPLFDLEFSESHLEGGESPDQVNADGYLEGGR